MDRRGFLSKLGLALAAVAVAPAISLLAEENTPCHQGLLWYAEHYGNRVTYSGNITMADFDELIKAMEQQESQEPIYYYGDQKHYTFPRTH